MTADVGPRRPGREHVAGETGVPAGGPGRGRAPTAPTRRLSRPPRARTLTVIGVLLLWGGALALLVRGAWGWAVVCGASAAVLGLGLLTSAAMARGLVAVTVRGSSMKPAYRDGDRVVARRGRPLRAGQVVVVEQPTPEREWPDPPVPQGAGEASMSERSWMIKRIVAVPGDPVPRARVPALSDAPEDRVPPGRLVLLGDNQEASYDSRHVGYFPAERVLGVVLRPLLRRGFRSRSAG
ncbi:S26 family signal peptidase [Streptosporangium sp. NPDC001559]|uniref:S26 family signal peptidase n=1 Tax=Streptosporangium sp. NPDC001559 TaxID=3366187 RepID=UPI0036EE758E